MELFVAHGSPNCRKVLAVVNHLNLDVHIQVLDFFAGELQTPEYQAINPNGFVPALKDGDFALWESNAIMQYLADSAGPNDLYPRDPTLRIDIHRWQFWEQAHFNAALGVYAFEHVLKKFLNQEPDSAALEAAEVKVHKFAPVLEAQLESHPFVIGGTITLADYALGCLMGFVEAAHMPLDGYPNINAWRERLAADPAWAATAPPPGITQAAE